MDKKKSALIAGHAKSTAIELKSIVRVQSMNPPKKYQTPNAKSFVLSRYDNN